MRGNECGDAASMDVSDRCRSSLGCCATCTTCNGGEPSVLEMLTPVFRDLSDRYARAVDERFLSNSTPCCPKEQM